MFHIGEVGADFRAGAVGEGEFHIMRAGKRVGDKATVHGDGGIAESHLPCGVRAALCIARRLMFFQMSDRCFRVELRCDAVHGRMERVVIQGLQQISACLHLVAEHGEISA